MRDCVEARYPWIERHSVFLHNPAEVEKFIAELRSEAAQIWPSEPRCPFCGYIGPPLLCDCVTEMRRALEVADAYMNRIGDRVPKVLGAEIAHAAVRQRERVQTLITEPES